MLAKMWNKGTLCIVGGIANWYSHYIKNSVDIPQKIKNRVTLWPSNTTFEYLLKENKNINLKIYALLY